ncbi:hypothetical protein P7K49_033194 [Saguinus oedipus]|uniref:Mucin-16 n=1 Tax=Saguinus oedipus TaxID=9490 RepID=A0ABQ9TR87_SAGOE|nr:hypothetical protein P7K49_033194 [Saguinus oedipus]
MSTALKTMTSKEPSISPVIKSTVSNSPWKTPETAVPMETTVEPVTLQSTDLGSGSTSRSHLPTGATSPTKSPIENMVDTDRVSLSPSPPETWTNLYSGTPGGTRQSLATMSSVSLESPTARSTMGTGQQSSPELISKTTGMDFSVWLGSTGGTTVDTHVSLSTSSNIFEDPLTSPNSVSSVVDNSKFKTKTWVSTTAIPSTVLRNKTVAAEQQTSPSVDEAYSSTSSLSHQTSGSDSTLGASPDVTNALHVTSTAQTPSLVSLLSGDQGITSLTSASGGKTSSALSVTSPSTGPETLMAIISVVTSDTAPTAGQLSQTSSPVEVSITGVATAPTPGITTTITTIGTNSILTTPSPEGDVSTMDSTLTTERSTSTEHTPAWSSTAASNSWTVTDMASNLKVASSPGTISTMRTTSFLASSTELDSMSTPNGLITVIGTSLVTPSSDASAIKTESNTHKITLSPSVTTMSTPISNFSHIQSTSVADISSTNWTPSRTETGDVPVSMAPTNYASTKTDPNMPLSTFLFDSLSTLNWDTGKSVSLATATTSAPHGDTTPQELTLEMMISPTTSRPPFSTGDITSGVTPTAMVRSSGVTFSRPDLTSKKAEQSSTQLPTTTSTHPEETIKVTSSSSLLRTSDTLDISLESAITSSSYWKSSPYESPYAPSKSTTDKESIHPSINIVETTPWVTSSKHASHSTVPAHSESSKLTSPVVTASTRRQAIFSISTTTWQESTRAGTEPNSSLTTELRDFNPYMDTSSTTQTSIISLPGSTAITKGPRTEITSSSERISSSFLAQSMKSSDRPSETITRMSNFPAMTESGQMTLTMQTGPPGTTSLSAPTLDTSATASWAGTPLAMTQRFTHSEETTLFSKGPEDTSQPSPASVEETSSFSSLTPIHATTSPSNTLLTSQGHSPSSAPPVTSVLWSQTSGLGKTTDLSRISLEPGTGLPPNLGSTAGEALSTYEATRDTKVIHPSENTAVINVEATSSENSSVPVHTQPSEATSPMATSHTIRDITASTLMFGSSETTEIETASSLNPGLQERSTSQVTSSATQTSTVIAHVSTGDAPTEVTKTQVTFSRRTSIPSPYHFKTSTNTFTNVSTNPSTSLIMTDSSGVTITTQTDSTGAATQGPYLLDTSTMPYLTETPLAVTPDFMQSEKTTPMSKGPRDVSWTSPPSVAETSSPSSLTPILVRTLPPATSTLQGQSTSSPVSMTSVITSELTKTTDKLNMSVKPVTISSQTLNNTSSEILSTLETTTDIEKIHPSINKAVTNTETTSSAHELYSTLPASSEPSTTTSPVVPASTMEDTLVSASTSDFETTDIEGEPTSFLNPGQGENSTTQESNIILSSVSVGADTKASKTEVSSFDATFIPTHAQSTKSPDIFSVTSSRLSNSPPMAISTHMTATQTGYSEATSKIPIALDTSMLETSAGTPSVVTEGFAHSKITTSMNSEAKDMSWTNPPFVEEASSPSSQAPVLVTTLASPVASTLQWHGTSSPVPMSSVLTSSLIKITGKADTSLEKVTSSPQSMSHTLDDILATSAATTDIETTHPSINIAVTNVGATSSAFELHSTASADSEPSKVTSPYITTSTMEDAMIFRSIPRSSKTTRIETETTSSLTPKLRETSISQEITSSTETSTVPYKELIGVTAKVSRTDVTSSSSTSIPGPDQSTVSLDIATETTTGLFTSPIMAESAEIIITTQTGPHGATSQDAFTTDTLNTTPHAGIHSVMTHGFSQSDVTTLMSRIPMDVSWTSPPSMDETSSPSSFLSLPAMTTPSLGSSTLPEDRLSSPMTSLLTSGLVKITDILHTRLEPVTSSLPHFRSTSDKMLATSNDGQDTAKIDPSINTAETNVKANNSGHESHSSTLADSETPKATTQMVIATTVGDPTPSTSMPMHGSSETTNIRREPTYFLTPRVTETSTSQESSFSTDMSFLLPKVPTGTITEVSGTEVISSSKISTPDHDRSTMQSDTFTGENTRVFTSSIMTKSAETTVTTQASPPGSASHEVTTFMSMGPENVSRMTTPLVEETSSASSLMSSPSPVSSTLQESIPSSLLPVTALPTSVLVTTTDVLGTTSPEPVTSSPPNLGSTTYERLITYKDSAHTETLHPSTNTAVSNVGTSSSGRESQSSVLADSETSKATSPMGKTSIVGDTSVSISTPVSSQTSQIQTESVTSLTPVLRDSSMSEKTSSATETNTVFSYVPMGATTQASRTEISSSRTSISELDQPTRAPNISTGMTTRLFTFPIMTRSAEMTITAQTTTPGATSQGTLPSDSSTILFQGGTHSVVSQGFLHPEITTFRSRTPRDVSWMTNPPVEETSSVFPLMSSPAMTSRSVSSTLPESIPSFPLPVTALPISVLVTTTDVLGTSPEPVTSSSPNLSSTTNERPATYKDTAHTEAMHPSTNTAVANVGTSRSGYESQSSVLADSETSRVTPPMSTTSTLGDTSVSISTPDISQTSQIQTELTASLTPTLRESITSEKTSSPTVTNTAISYVPTGVTTQASRTEISSSRTSISELDQSTVAPDISTEMITRFFTSPIMTKSAEVTITTQTTTPGATSQGTLPSDSSTTLFQGETHSTASQGFPHSEITTLRSRIPGDVSQMTTPPVEETSPASSLMSSPAMTSPSPVFSTLPESIPSSPLPVTALPTSVLVTTTDVLGTSPEPVTSSSPNLSSTTNERPATYKDTAHTEAMHPSTNTAVANVGTSSSGYESQSSVLADSETSKATSPMGTTFTMWDTRVSTSNPALFEARIQMESTSSWTPGLKDTSMSLVSEETNTVTETSTFLSEVPTTATTEVLRTEVINSSRTSVSGSDDSKMLPYISTETITSLSTSPVVTGSTEMTITKQTGSIGTTSQATITLETSSTASCEGTHPPVTQRFSHSEDTTTRSRGTVTVSWQSPPSVEETSSPSSLGTLPAITSFSPIYSTLSGSSPASSLPVTSPILVGGMKTTEMLDTSSEPVTSTLPSTSSFSGEIPNSDTSKNTETIHFSQNIAENNIGATSIMHAIAGSENTVVTQVGTTRDIQAVYSASPGFTELPKVTNPMITASAIKDIVSTTIPASSEITRIELESTSTLTPSTSLEIHSATETSIVPYKGLTGAMIEGSMTQVTSSSRGPSPDQSTMSPDISTEVNTRLSTSPIKTESTEMTITTQKGSAGATSQGTLTSDTSTTTFLSGTHSTASQGFSHSDMTTLLRGPPGDVPWMSQPSVEETSSVSSLLPSPAMTSPSPVSSTFPDSIPSSSLPGTSLLTLGPVKTTDLLDTSSEPETSSPPNLSSTLAEILTTSDVTPDTEKLEDTNVGTSRYTRESSSSVLADSVTTKATSPMGITSPTGGTSVLTSSPALSDTRRIQTEPTLSLTPGLSESSTSEGTSSAKETSTVHSSMPADATPEVSRTGAISSSRTSTHGPAESTMSPGISMETIARISITPTRKESAEMNITPKTGPSGASSQGTFTLDASSTASWPGTHSAAPQKSPQSAVTTPVSRGSEDLSWSSPSSVEHTSPPSSLVPSPSVTSPSPLYSTLPGRSPSSPLLATSLFTSGTMKTTDMLDTSLEPVTMSPPSMNITADESLATPKVTMEIEATDVSENAAVTHVGTTRAVQEVYSSSPGFSELPKVTSPRITSSATEDIVSATIPASSEITRIEMESTSTLTPSPSLEIHPATETSTVPYKALTGAMIEVSETQVTSSSRGPSPDQSTMSPDISTEVNTRLSTSPIKTESTEMTITTQKGSPGATSQGTLTSDTSTTTFLSGTHSTASQGFSHSDMTTLLSGPPGDVPWTSQPSVEETSSVSSLLPSPAMTSPSPVSSTFPDSIPSSSLPGTSLLTLGPVKTTDLLDTSSEPETSSPPNLSSTLAEILTTSDVTPDTEKLEVTNVGTSRYTRESPSSVLADSVTTKATSPMGITSPTGGTSVLTSSPALSDTRRIQTEPTLSLTPGLSESSTSEGTSSATETSTVHSSMPAGATPEVSRTGAISSSRTSTHGPAESTMSPGISMETIARISITPTRKGSAEMNITPKTGPSGASSQGTFILDASSTASWPGTHSAAPQRSPQSAVTTPVSRGSEDLSWSSPSSVEHTSPPSSLVPSPSVTSPSPLYSTLSGRSPSSPLLATSLFTSGTMKTTDMLDTNLEPVTMSPPSMNITADESLATSKVTMEIEAIDISENAAVTRVGTTRAVQEVYSSSPGFSELPKVTSPRITSSATEDIVSATIPASSEITRIEMESTSTLTPSPSLEIHPATETSTVPYKALTGAMIEVSEAQVTSSSRGPSPDQSTMSPDISTEVNTRLSTSPIKTESTEMTITTQKGSPGATSQGTLTSDTSTTTFLSGTHSTASQGFSHSDMATLLSGPPGDVPWTSQPSVEETSSVSSLLPSPAMTSPSPVSSTFPDSIPSSSLPGTSLLTLGPVKTTDLLDTSSEPETSSPPNLSSTLAEILTTSDVTPDTEKLEVTNVGTSRYTRESPSSVLADSVTTKATSPMGITSPTGGTSVLTSSPALSDTRRIQTEPTLSLTPGLSESSTSEGTSSATETSTVHSSMPAGATPEVSRTGAISSSRTSTHGPAESTMSPGISMETIARISITPIRKGSAEMNITPKTGPSGASSQGTFILDASSTASWPGTHSAAPQRSPQSAVTTPVSRGSEDLSWSSPSSVEHTSPPSSLVPSPSVTSPSPLYSTLSGRSPSSPLLATSLFTSGTMKTTDMLDTSLEPVTMSPPSMNITADESLATSKVTMEIEAIDISENAAVTHVGTTRAVQEVYSSSPGFSELPKVTSPRITSSATEDIVSATIPASSEITRIEMESTSTLTPSPSLEIHPATKTSTVPYKALTRAMIEGSKTQVTSSSRGPSPDQSRMSPDISTEVNTRLSTSPIKTESTEMTITTQKGSPGATSQGTVTSDTSTTTFLSGTHSTASQGFSHSDMTTLLSGTPVDVPWTSQPSVEETSSVSSLLPSPAMTSPSPVSSTFPDSIPSSSLPGTSLLTLGPVKTTDLLDTSSEPETSSPPNLSSTLAEILTTSDITLDTEKLEVTNLGTSRYTRESPSSVLADSVTTKATSPMGITCPTGGTSVLTSNPALSDMRRIQTEPTLSLTPGLSESSTSEGTSSATETSTVHSSMPAGATPEVSRTGAISSSRTSTHGPAESTMSPGISMETIAGISITPTRKESAEMTITPKTGPSGASSQGTFTLDASSTASWPGTHSAAPQRSPQSAVTTPVSRGSEDLSWSSPSSVEHTSPPSSLVPSPSVTSPSPLYSTLSGRSPSSPLLGTSLFTSGTMKTTDMLDTSLEPVTMSPPSMNITADESLATSKVTMEIEAIDVFENAAVTHVGTTRAVQEVYSSSPGFSELPKVTSPRITSSATEDIVSATIPASSEITRIEMESTSTLTPSPSLEIHPATETSTVPYKVLTGVMIEGSKTQVTSSSRGPRPDQSTMSPDVSTEVNTRLSTSPIKTESMEMTITTQKGSPGATSQGTLTLDTSTTTFLSGTHSTASQGFSHSDMTTLLSGPPGDVPWTSQPSVEETSSVSSLLPSPAMTSPSPVSSTFPDSIPSSSLPGTSLLTLGPVKTTDLLDTSSEPETSSPPNLSSTLAEILTTSDVTPDTEKLEVTNVGTSRYTRESSSSVLADSVTTKATSPMGITSPTGGTRVLTSSPALSDMRRIQTEPTLSLTPGLSESRTSEGTSSATEASTVHSIVSTGVTPDVSRTGAMFSSRTSTHSPAESTMSPGISMETSIISIPLTRIGSGKMTITRKTGPVESTSQGTFTFDTSSTDSWPGTHSAATQRSSQSLMSTPMSRGSEDLSWPSPSSVEKSSPSSTLVSLSPVTSTSPLHSSASWRSHFSPLLETSPFTSGMMETTDMFDTSWEPMATSPSSMNIISDESLATSKVTMETQTVYISENTAISHVETTNAREEFSSSSPAFSEPTKVTSPMITSSSVRDNIVSTTTPGSSGITRIEIESVSSLAPGLRLTRPSQDIISSTETSTVLYKMPSGTTPEVSRTEVMPSSRTSTPGPAKLTMSPDISDEVVTRLSTSSITTEPAEITTTQTGSSLTTSQVTLPLGTSTTFLLGTHPTLSQELSHSEMTSLMSRGLENMSWTSPHFVETTRSSSSLTSLPLMTSLSPVSSALVESSPSSLPVTSLTLPGLLKTTEVLGTSSEPKTSSSPNLSSTSVEMPATSEVITDTKKIHPSSNTAVTKVGTSSSVHESHSSVLAESETTTTTSSMGITPPIEDASVFTSTPAFSETRIPTEPTFSLTPGFRETSTSEETSSITETSAVLFGVPTSAITEVSMTEIMSSNRTHIPDSDQSTVSPNISTEVITRLPSSSMMSESTEMTNTPQTSSPGATRQSTLPLAATTTPPLAGTHSTVPQRLLHSEMTTLMSRSPKNPSWKSSPFVEKSSFSSSVLSSPAMTSPSVSSIFPQSFPSSSFPVTSLLTPGMVKTTTTSTEPGTSLSPNLSSSSVEILAASEVTTDAEKIHPSSSTAVTNVGTTSSGHELHSSVPIHSEPSKAAYPMGTSSSMAESTIFTSMPANFEITRFEAEPFSHLTSGFRDTSMSLDKSSVTPTNTPSFPVSTHLLQSSKTDVTSSVKTPFPDQPPASQYTEIPEEIITPFNASLSVMESTGITSFPESKFTMSVSESTHHLSTDLLHSAETISTGTAMPSLSETVASFVATGVPQAISGSSSPLSSTESSPGDANLSTTAESLPSSTPVPFSSSTFTITDFSTIPALHGITSSPATPHRMDTSSGTEGSTIEGYLVTVSTLDTWSQPARTSSSPILDTRMTESLELGTVTSAYQVPSLSTRLTRKDP